MAITFQDCGELEATRALSATSSDDEIVVKEGFLTMSHLLFHLREQLADTDVCWRQLRRNPRHPCGLCPRQSLASALAPTRHSRPTTDRHRRVALGCRLNATYTLGRVSLSYGHLFGQQVHTQMPLANRPLVLWGQER